MDIFGFCKYINDDISFNWLNSITRPLTIISKSTFEDLVQTWVPVQTVNNHAFFSDEYWVVIYNILYIEVHYMR